MSVIGIADYRLFPMMNSEKTPDIVWENSFHVKADNTFNTNKQLQDMRSIKKSLLQSGFPYMISSL